MLNDKRYMTNIDTILEQYWGYKQFRPLQADIIQSVLAGKDTIALLPTGGGKSVCFQVPAMVLEGICIVVSPLIALMKDQVEQLLRRGIFATVVYSGMDFRQIDKVLDECVSGKAKFLYLSPERLQTELFKERAKRMKISLLAIDEAHCISQWGYDFRPPYLEIAEFRKTIPHVPIIALTATATPQVKQDIQTRLVFRQDSKAFQKSFARPNLSYTILQSDDKGLYLLQALKRLNGSAVVYVRSRNKTQQITEFLQKNLISADYYHAGLPPYTRAMKQDAWIQNKTRVIVSTNAFGMGIDKPDVRLVVHWEVPDSLEAYYQEAGRAGRDEQKAYAVALYSPRDMLDMRQRITQAYPPVEVLRNVYQSLANYLQIPVGAGEFAQYDFDLAHFQTTFNLKGMGTYHALKRLTDEGVIDFNEAYQQPSKIQFKVTYRDLYEFQMKNEGARPLIVTLSRLYGSEVQNQAIRINENDIAKSMGLATAQIRKQLLRLHELEIIDYQEQKDKPQVTFLTPRYDGSQLPINQDRLASRKQRDLDRLSEVEKYSETKNRCRTQLLQEYFGEVSYESCGVCDVCVKKQRLLTQSSDETLQILHLLAQKPCTLPEMEENLAHITQNVLSKNIKILLDAGLLHYLESGKLARIEGQ
jgi:ATP-dependent DNA helicase RecQ